MEKFKLKISRKINRLMCWCARKTGHKYRIFRDIATVCTPKTELERINGSLREKLQRDFAK